MNAANASAVTSHKPHTIADPEILAALIEARRDGVDITPAMLAERLGRDPSNLSKSLRKMREHGMIEGEFDVPAKYRAVAAVWTGGDMPAPPQPDGTLRPLPPDGMVPLSAIHPCKLNPRKTFDADSIAALAESIADQGLLQNVTLRPRPGDDGAFELIAGERRFRALQRLAADRRIPEDYAVRAEVRDVADDDVLLMALAENTAREDMAPIDQAEAFVAYYDAHVARVYRADGAADMTLRKAQAEAVEALSRAAGVTDRVIQRRMKVVREARPKVIAAVRGGTITMRAAETLATATAEDQDALLALHQRGEDGYRTADDLAERLKEARAQREWDRANAEVDTPAPAAEPKPIMDGSTGTPDPAARDSAGKDPADRTAFQTRDDLAQLWEALFDGAARLPRGEIETRLKAEGVVGIDAAITDALGQRIIAEATPHTGNQRFVCLVFGGQIHTSEHAVLQARKAADGKPAGDRAADDSAPREDVDWLQAAREMKDGDLLAELGDVIGRGDLKLTGSVQIRSSNANPKRAHAAIRVLFDRIEFRSSGTAKATRVQSMHQLARG